MNGNAGGNMSGDVKRYQEIGQRVRKELDALSSGSTLAEQVKIPLFSGPAPRASRVGRRTGWLPLLGVGALAAAAAVTVWWPQAPVSFTIAEQGTGIPGAAIVAEADQKLVAFSEGTTLVVRPRTRARITRARADGADVLVDSGTVTANVTPRKAGRWAFFAGPYTVTVTGTRFDLTWDERAGRLTVAMRHGRVIVSGGAMPEPREVRAGEVLTAGEQGPTIAAISAAIATPAPPREPRSAGAAPGLPSAPAPAVAPSAALAGAPNTATRAPVVRAGAKKIAFASDPRETSLTANVDSPAGRLFARADQARLAGRERAAVNLFEQLVRDFPSDNLAGLAAFAAGRLRLLRLNDPRGALVDLERARRRGLGAALAEDCQARIVEALGRLGDHTRCAQERARYLGAFPEGTHALAVARACD